jgi:hypothetical protein
VRELARGVAQAFLANEMDVTRFKRPTMNERRYTHEQE